MPPPAPPPARSKTFEANEDDETLASETLREISALRLMRGKNGNAGILRLLDVIEHEGGAFAPVSLLNPARRLVAGCL